MQHTKRDLTRAAKFHMRAPHHTRGGRKLHITLRQHRRDKGNFLRKRHDVRGRCHGRGQFRVFVNNAAIALSLRTTPDWAFGACAAHKRDWHRLRDQHGGEQKQSKNLHNGRMFLANGGWSTTRDSLFNQAFSLLVQLGKDHGGRACQNEPINRTSHILLGPCSLFHFSASRIRSASRHPSKIARRSA